MQNTGTATVPSRATVKHITASRMNILLSLHDCSILSTLAL